MMVIAELIGWIPTLEVRADLDSGQLSLELRIAEKSGLDEEACTASWEYWQ